MGTSRLSQEFDNKRSLKSSNTIREQQKRYAKKQLRGKKVTSQLRKHGEHYASGKYSGAHKPTSSDSGDAVDAQANTNPRIDSEVASSSQPQMSTRATRIVRRPTRFVDSSDEDDSDSETPNPIPFPKPPSDSEVTSPPQPQMSTRVHG